MNVMLLETKALMRNWKFWFVLHLPSKIYEQGTFSISTLTKQIISQTTAQSTNNSNLDKMCINQNYLLHTLKCHAVVAFFFSNLTLKGVNLQNFGGVFFFPNLTLKGVNLQKFGGVIFFKFDT